MNENELDALRKQNAELLLALREVVADLERRARARGDVDSDGTAILDIGSSLMRRVDDLLATAAQSAPASAPDWISYDATNDVLTIHGIRHSGELMRDFSEAMPCGQPFEIVERGHGILAVRRLDRPAAANADGLEPYGYVLKTGHGNSFAETLTHVHPEVRHLWVPVYQIAPAEKAGGLPAYEAKFQHEITELVMRHIDRMNDVCEQDTADNIIASFTRQFDPIFEAYMAEKFPGRAAAVGAGGQHD